MKATVSGNVYSRINEYIRLEFNRMYTALIPKIFVIGQLS